MSNSSALLHEINVGLSGAQIIRNEYELLQARLNANEALISGLDDQLTSIVDHRVRNCLTQLRHQLQDNVRQMQPLLDTISAELEAVN